MYAIEVAANAYGRGRVNTYYYPKFYLDIDGAGIPITTEDQAREVAEDILTTVYDLGVCEEGDEVRLDIKVHRITPEILGSLAYIESVEI